MTAIVSMAFGLREIPSPKPGSSHTTTSVSLSLCNLNTSSHHDYNKNKDKSSVMINQNHKISEFDNQQMLNLHMTHETLFTKETKCLVWGLQVKAVQSMLDFDYASERDSPSVAALIYPFKELSVYVCHLGFCFRGSAVDSSSARNTPSYELSKDLALILCPVRNRSNSRPAD
ncbi:unnamed protein product [Trichobilharzia regenti]|nr:unnamed protein product [Trichobilharzia regenti]